MGGANFIAKICNPNRYSVPRFYPQVGAASASIGEGGAALTNMLATASPMVYRAAPGKSLARNGHQRTINPPVGDGRGRTGQDRAGPGMARADCRLRFLAFWYFLFVRCIFIVDTSGIV